MLYRTISRVVFVRPRHFAIKVVATPARGSGEPIELSDCAELRHEALEKRNELLQKVRQTLRRMGHEDLEELNA